MNFDSESDMLDYMEKHCYAGVISDVLDELGYRFQVISPTAKISPLSEDFVAMGRACTMLNAPDDKKDEPYDLAIQCIEKLNVGSVLVTTGNVDLEAGIMGELSATALVAKGCRGAIVNGYTRDVRKLVEMHFPTFAWGSSPIDTTGRARVIAYDTPISIGGVQIQPADLIYSDLDGIVVIPKKIENKVITMVLTRITDENIVRKELANGENISEVWNKYHIL